MNLSSVIGIILCVILLIFGMVFSEDTMKFEFGNVLSFLNLPSMFIVVAGTIAALIATFPFKQLATMFKHIPIILGLKKYDPTYYINVMTELSQEARRKGLLALEDQVSSFKDPFLRDSVMLIVDAMEPDKVREQLENEIGNIESRHASAWDMYDKGSALAPAFGMMGTVIGLVNMTKSMNFDDAGGASSLASGMAVVMITTLYGSILSNIFFIPMSTQLRVAHNEEMLCKEIIIEGIISIQAGENPRHINEKLLSFLTRSQREKHTGDIE